MPIYEYRCRRCDKEFEKYVHGPTTSVACPSCDGSDVMRKLSVFGLRSEGAMPSTMAAGGGGCCGGGGCGCH